MNRITDNLTWLALLSLSGSLWAAEPADENLEFPPLLPDEVITGEVPVEAVMPAASAEPAQAAVASSTAAVAAQPAPAAAEQYAPLASPAGAATQAYAYPQGYYNAQAAWGPSYYPGYSGYYPGYAYGSPYGSAYYGYGQPSGYPGYYGAPSSYYYGYRRPVRKSGNWPFGGDWPWFGGTWTEGPWNNGKFSRGDWLGGGPSSWFRGGDFKEGLAEMWDDMINAPAEMGTMPGGWEFPTVSAPNPVDVGDELGKAAPQLIDELPNMIDINP